MTRHSILKSLVLAVLFTIGYLAVAKGGVIVENGGRERSQEEAVLFAFDDYSIPLVYGLQPGLIAGKKHAKNPVVRMGNPGEVDAKAVSYYGTVIRIGDQLRMWYIGAPEVNYTGSGGWPGWGFGRICYAVSNDGIRWEKPALGLVEFRGSKKNNLVDLNMDRIVASTVIYEADDPDPNRRFKMVFETGRYGQRMAVAYSADGLTWKQSPNNPVGPILEMTGLTKINGAYYVNGQGIAHTKRTLVTHVSYDFENWTESAVLGLRRDKIAPNSPILFPRAGEQVHLGAALWDRGNVLVGFYGQWHGDLNNDRRYISMDLGLVLTQDGLRFREPVPDFRIISAAEESDGAHPSLIQGQGFENIGDQTMVWYGAWRDGEIRLATWKRDRLGYLEPVKPHHSSEGGWSLTRYHPASSKDSPHFITCPLKLGGEAAKIFINADGLSENTYLQLELLDEQLRSIPGYSGNDSALIKKGGLRQAVSWKGNRDLKNFNYPIRIRISYMGLRPEDVRVYAIYLTEK